MNPAAARLLTRLYPQPWRERYGEEFEALLLDSRGSLRSDLHTCVNVARSAFSERIFPTTGGKMNQPVFSFRRVIKQPSALVPLAMSLAALSLVVGHIALYGAAREADEGAVAHLWQILMAGQMPVLAFFAIRWLPRAPRPAIGVLALQAGAVLASMAPVLFFNL
jgi:hypothetical protein